MNLRDTLEQMARLMVQHDHLHYDAMIRHTPRPGATPTPAMQKAIDDLHNIDRCIARLAESSAADPLLYPHMVCWMVDITGSSDAAVPPLGVTPTDPRGSTGSLQFAVRQALDEHNLTYTDSGTGDDRWDISVHCNDGDVATTCHLMHTRFSKAIDSGLLRVRRRFWRWRFKALPSAPAAIAYLKNQTYPFDQ